jgi:hypothetical protein
LQKFEMLIRNENGEQLQAFLCPELGGCETAADLTPVRPNRAWQLPVAG